VATGCIDLRASPDSGTFAEMGRRIERAAIGGDARFDTLYVSNLPWMLAQREGFFGESNAQFAAGSDGVLAQVRENLETIVPYFRHIVAAGHLAGTSREANLQWETRLLTPSAFLDRAWRRSAVRSGACARNEGWRCKKYGKNCRGCRVCTPSPNGPNGEKGTHAEDRARFDDFRRRSEITESLARRPLIQRPRPERSSAGS
jgi:hypothetical protein